MRVLIFILSLIFITGSANAQAKKSLKGPAAKNYKPWKDKKVDTDVVYIQTSSLPQSRKGPAAKNYKPWKDSNDIASIALASNSTKTLIRRTGPAAKNHKPWKKSKSYNLQDSSLVSTED